MSRFAKVTVGGTPRVVDLARSVPLFTTNYDGVTASDTAAPPWQVEQEPASPGAGGTLQTSRISVAAAGSVPGTGTYKPAGQAMRVELRRYETSTGATDGDVTDTGGFLANRSEVYARHASPGNTAPELWPDPVGAVRWYGFSLLVPAGHTFASDAKWLTFTQWKGRDGSSPPVGLEINHSNLRLGGARANASLLPVTDLGAAVTGTWTRLVVGLRFSPDPAIGWVEAWRDGAQIVSPTSVATMDYQVDGVTPDPIYLKQGIYRDTAWTVTHVLWFGPTKMGRTRAAVA